MRRAVPIPVRRVRRVWRAIGIALVLLVIWLSLTPHPIAIPVDEGDKLGHFAAYAVLMCWFAQLDVAPRPRLAYAAFFVALGVVLEFVQGLTDYRSFEVADMAADTVGVMLGWAAAPPRGPNVLALVEHWLAASS